MNEHLKKFYFTLITSILYLYLTSRFGVYSKIDFIILILSMVILMIGLTLLLKWGD